jgi:hypothetical protein
MKRILPPSFRAAWPLAAMQLGLLLAPGLQAAVTFTNTPAVVSNTYSGFITLQAQGLTNGETVIVQKFLDLNGNGVIDAGDWLVQQFAPTDGQAGMVIGGIVNSNVPGDTDTVPGQITAALNFQNGDFMQNFSANYLYALSSPSGRFTPITNLFVVTNVPYPQKFTGQVLLAGAGTPVPYTPVLLFGPPKPGKGGPNGSPLAATAADATGSYSLPVPPGTYMPVAFASNCVADFGAPVVLALTNNQTLATNLSVIGATNTISGTLVDANNPGLPLPGVLFSASSDSGLFTVTLTSSNGGFTLGVEAGQWTLQPDDNSLIVQGYVGPKNGTNVNAGAAGVAVGAPKATALFYGRATNTQGAPFASLDISAYDNNNYYDSDGYTDANGYYCAGALGGLGAGDPWQVGISSDTALANYVFSQPALDSNGGTNIAAGQAILANFTGLFATNQISGYLKDNNNNGISGVGIWANGTIGGVTFNPSADTDSSGYYSFSVGNGTWSVGVNTGSGGDSLSPSYIPSVSQTVVIANSNATVNFVALPAAYGLSGTVQLAAGGPVVGVNVSASATINGFTYQRGTDTSGGGGYALNVASGDWSVSVQCFGPMDSLQSVLGTGNYECPNSQNVGITNRGGTANFTIQPPASFQITNASLPNGTVGANYSAPLGATGGQPPYGFSLANGSGPLPGGLALNSSGLISGTPTNSGTWQFNLEATDNGPDTAYQLLSITIHPKPLLEAPRKLGNSLGFWLIGVTNQNYTLQMSTNLSSTNWVSLLVTNNPTTNNFAVIDPAATNRYRFYRVLIGP